MADCILTLAEVADLLRVSPHTLRWWKHRGLGEGPRSFNIGRRVAYRESDVQAWLDEQYAAGAPGARAPRAWC